MQNITLEYRPFPFLKYTRKIKGAFPSAFGELKPAQLIAIAGLLNQKISETDFLNIMTGIPKFRIKKLDAYYRYQLMLLFEPFIEIKPYEAFIIPTIKTSKGILASPNPKLARMTFAQFIFADSYFASYQTGKETVDLCKFVASIYLPKLQTFSEDKVSAAALTIAKINPLVLDAIVINYVLLKDWLALAYPMVFQKEDDYDENFEPMPRKHDKPVNHSAWIKIYDSVVGDDLVNHDRYALLPLHTVLRWMTEKITDSMKNRKN
jgi:hypothetical protein